MKLIVRHGEMAFPLLIEYLADATTNDVNHVKTHHRIAKTLVTVVALWPMCSQSLLQGAQKKAPHIWASTRGLARTNAPKVATFFQLHTFFQRKHTQKHLIRQIICLRRYTTGIYWPVNQNVRLVLRYSKSKWWWTLQADESLWYRHAIYQKHAI